MPQFLISYRRDDSQEHSKLLYQRLREWAGEENVFRDLDSMRLGRDFEEELYKALKRSAAVLVVIGPNWIDARDEHGNRRLVNPSDFVRREITTAFRLNVDVVPVLLDSAEMPTIDQLPRDLHRLPTIQACWASTAITEPDFPNSVSTTFRT